MLENLCLFTQIPQQNIRLQPSKLISGISDILNIQVKYTVDSKKRQILFNFRIINMSPFLIEDISIDFESN